MQTSSSSFQLLKGLLSTSDASDVFTAVKAEGSRGVPSPGVCATHGFIVKKSGIQSLINAPTLASLGLTAVESHLTVKYSSTVLHLEVSNVPIGADQFKRLLECFPHLEGLLSFRSFVFRPPVLQYMKSILIALSVCHLSVALCIIAKRWKICL